MKSPNLKNLTKIAVCCAKKQHCVDYAPEAGLPESDERHYINEKTKPILQQLTDALAAVKACEEMNVALVFSEEDE